MARSDSTEQDGHDPRDGEACAAEARRQSLLVADLPSEVEALRFVVDVADDRDWK